MKLIVLLLVLLNINVLAQSVKNPNIHIINGHIIDENHVPLPAAILRLYHSDSTLVKEYVTNSKGYFKFEMDRSKIYYITVNYIGYERLTISTKQIAASQNGLLGDISLTESTKVLKQVIVTARQPIIQQRTDRTVIVVNDQVKKMAENALDVIRLAPGLTVSDNEDAIMMSGKDAVNVMINDKLVKMTNRDLVKLLKSLPVSSVNQLDVMTNPSSKYDVSGNTGLLNIKTKQNAVKGFTGNTDLSHSQAKHSMGDLSSNLNYGAGKFAVSSYLAYHYGNYPTFSVKNRILNNGELFQNSTSTDKWSDPALRLTAEYYINSKQTVGVLLGYEASTNTSNYQTLSQFHQTSLKDTAYQTDGFGPNISHWNTYNLNYRYIGAGSELSFDADRSLYNKDDKNSIINANAVSNSMNGNAYQTLTNITINTLKGDYTHTWKSKLKMEAGFKLSAVNTNNRLAVSTISNGISKVDSNQTNSFIYKEYINAAYLNFAQNYNKWGIQIGLRLEQSRIKGISTDAKNNQNFKPDSSYISLLPAVYLTYRPSAVHNFRLSINQRVKRPNYNALQPFTYQIDAFDYQTGNPALRVQKNTSLELSYTYNDRVTIASSYNHTTDFFNPVMYTIGDAVYQTTLNSGKMDTWNFVVNYPIKIYKWWTMLNKLNTFYNHFNGQLYQGVLNTGKWGYLFSTSQRFTLPGKYQFLVSARYNSPTQNLIYYQQSNANVSISISKKILKDQGSFRLGLSDLFNTQRTNTIVNFGNLQYQQNDTWESRRISLGFTWRFGNKNIKETQERTTGSRDEKSRSGS